jgi:hypothetical protein
MWQSVRGSRQALQAEAANIPVKNRYSRDDAAGTVWTRIGPDRVAVLVKNPGARHNSFGSLSLDGQK